MSNPTIRTCQDSEDMSQQAASALIALGQQAIAQRGRFMLTLSGGSTPRALFQTLTRPEYRDQLDWSRVEFFWGDERTVPPDDPAANFRMANEHLLQPLGVSAEQVHRIEAELADHRAAAKYAETIATCWQTSPAEQPPSFDLILLGMGDDGHTASLFPHTEALEISDRWVVENHVPQLDTTRITMTYPLINRARAVFFLVAGAGKAPALKEVLQGAENPSEYPSQRIQPSAGQLEWFVDQAAASQLKPAGS